MQTHQTAIHKPDLHIHLRVMVSISPWPLFSHGRQIRVNILFAGRKPLQAVFPWQARRCPQLGLRNAGPGIGTVIGTAGKHGCVLCEQLAQLADRARVVL
jgi:hypothetical protein